MHKQLINEAVIDLLIIPMGPILVKAGESGADPTRPDMEFVRTWHGGQEVIYLPGSSLKGVIRAHCERIARTLQEKAPNDVPPLSCNPLKEGGQWGHDDFACSKYFERPDVKRELEDLEKAGEQVGAVKHQRSCFICQLFGNTSLAGHLRTADAYPVALDKVKIEERNGVAIDRVFGSVAVGPFQFEVCTEGEFKTKLYLKNFTVAQLGLVALALRDLKEGRVGLGFAKSRGLGQVTLKYLSFQASYPTWELLKQRGAIAEGELPGVARLLPTKEAKDYGYLRAEEAKGYGYEKQADDQADLPAGKKLEADGWLGAQVTLGQEADIETLWKACVPAWAKVAGLVKEGAK
ncbi:MAG: CRISPR-associated protein [Chloroflexi bacterium]|nr:CRISPR-associated protein [Chloroflexota bacterium]